MNGHKSIHEIYMFFIVLVIMYISGHYIIDMAKIQTWQSIYANAFRSIFTYLD